MLLVLFVIGGFSLPQQEAIVLDFVDDKKKFHSKENETVDKVVRKCVGLMGY